LVFSRKSESVHNAVKSWDRLWAASLLELENFAFSDKAKYLLLSTVIPAILAIPATVAAKRMLSL